MKNFNLKKFLKNLKLKEESISVVLGAVVVVIVGILVVNYFRDKNSQTLPEALTTETPNSVEVGKNYKVEKGETLWSISEDAYGSGYNWMDIYKANNLKSENLEIGQELMIPDVTAKEPTLTNQVIEATPVTTVAPVATEERAITGDTYTVTKGDSLWSISVKAYGDGYKWTEVSKANKLTQPNLIHPGNVLVLPR